MNEYQELTLKTSRGRTSKNELYHLVLGLVGEAGEVSEIFKKLIRDNSSDENLIDRTRLKKELGDVLWYIAVLADYLELELEDIASSNIAKLADRQRRNVIGGSGNDR